jgi:eukaryotic-like serine/threonine-protein kinase
MMDLDQELVTALAGRYEIEDELGRGGMAIVYRARDVKHGRQVALKVMRPELAASLGAERFLREIDIAASLNHPNILPLYDSGAVSGTLYYAMPYVDGPTLRQRLDVEVQLPIDDALAITQQIAAALDYAHARGVIHRDIKPDNILLLGSHVLIADFGLARAISSAASTPLTEKRFVVGTAAYMSPEQCTPGRAVDARNDIYSLGCVVFEMIAGVAPFRGATPEATMSHHLTSNPPSVCIERPRCPRALDTAVRRALAKAPADRFRTATEFSAALDAAALSGERRKLGVDPFATGSWTRERSRWLRNVAAVAAIVAITASGFAALTKDGVHWPWRTPPPDTTRLVTLP